MKLRTTVSLVILVTSCSAGDRDLRDAGEFVEVTAAPAIEIKPKKDIPGLEILLDRISLEPSQGGPPSSYAVSGRIVSGNSGRPLERIPVLVGLDRLEPRLAALTNMDGEFKFRLWIKEDHRDSEIQVPKGFSGFLYVGSSSTAIIFGQSELLGYGAPRLRHADYRRYPLRWLFELSNAQNEATAAPEMINFIVGLREPQSIPWTPNLTIWDVIKQAGTTYMSPPRKARLIRGTDCTVVDLSKIKHGEIPHPKLQPGDTIELPD